MSPYMIPSAMIKPAMVALLVCLPTADYRLSIFYNSYKNVKGIGKLQIG